MGRCKGGPIEGPGCCQSRPVGPHTSGEVWSYLSYACGVRWGYLTRVRVASSPMGAERGRSPAAMPKEGPLLALKLLVFSSSLLPHSLRERADLQLNRR